MYIARFSNVVFRIRFDMCCFDVILLAVAQLVAIEVAGSDLFKDLRPFSPTQVTVAWNVRVEALKRNHFRRAPPHFLLAHAEMPESFMCVTSYVKMFIPLV